MINRILIRIKVVQLLYSYLLSLSEFKIEAAPENATRDRRFAYAVYLDMLMLIQALSGLKINNPQAAPLALNVNKYLKANRVGKALADNHELKQITFKSIADFNAIAPCVQTLANKIVASEAFGEYSRRRARSLDDDVRFWTTILETVVLKDGELNQALRNNSDFSLTGLHHGVMAAVDTLKDYNNSSSAYFGALNELQRSLQKSYDLYLSLFALIIELTDEQIDRIEAAKTKYLATAEDLNPNMRLAHNRFAEFLRQNETITKFIDDNKFRWIESPGLLKQLHDTILDSDIYSDYINSPADDWHTDCEFWRSVLRNIVIPSDAFSDALEAKSIYWNDDIDTVGTFALKTIRKFSLAEDPATVEFMPQYKDQEDATFSTELFKAAIANKDTYREYIDRFISQDWDPDRLAFMDIVIMITAIAEILNFPTIPVPVSLNEYIEIANNYSTPRSGSFINGILYSVVKMLAEDGSLGKPFTIARRNDEPVNND